ncbi:MAG: hypothetical protein Kow0010_23340 [Dehalococcoidia bacterium]
METVGAAARHPEVVPHGLRGHARRGWPCCDRLRRWLPGHTLTLALVYLNSGADADTHDHPTAHADP